MNYAHIEGNSSSDSINFDENSKRKITSCVPISEYEESYKPHYKRFRFNSSASPVKKKFHEFRLLGERFVKVHYAILQGIMMT